MSNPVQAAGGDNIIGSVNRREVAAALRAEGLTFAAIGQRLGVTSERARQLLLPLRRAKGCRTCGRPIPHVGSYCQLSCRPSYTPPTGRPRGRPRLHEKVAGEPREVMSQPARVARRQRIAQLVRDGKTLIDIKESERVSTGTIRVACKEAGILCPSVSGRHCKPRTKLSARSRAKPSSSPGTSKAKGRTTKGSR